MSLVHHAVLSMSAQDGARAYPWVGSGVAYLALHPRCEVCHARATTVDHIKARKLYGVDHSPSNLRALCPACAASKDKWDRQEGARRKKMGGAVRDA